MALQSWLPVGTSILQALHLSDQSDRRRCATSRCQPKTAMRCVKDCICMVTTCEQDAGCVVTVASIATACIYICACAEVTRRSLAEAAPESVPTSSAGPSGSAEMSDGQPDSYQIPSFVPIPYTHLWVSSDGNTHIAECKLKNLMLSSYIGGQGGLQAQSYRETLPPPSSELIIQLAANQYNPPHTAPSSQFVSVLSGRW